MTLLAVKRLTSISNHTMIWPLVTFFVSAKVPSPMT